MPDPTSESVAIIGMAGRFPGADTLEQFWVNIAGGVESISHFSREEMLAAGAPAEQIDLSAYRPFKPILPGIDCFDAAFFGFSERDAALTDPQHRLFLETAWAAFEDAGHIPSRAIGRIGVFASCSKNTYLIRNLLPAADWSRSEEVFQLLAGNEKDYLAPRTAHVLDATGPALTVQTACSSSLVAVHLAVQSLLAGECDFALAGGASVDVPAVEGYLHRPRGILSADGRCRPFSPDSSGTVFGHGVAAVVLRRTSEADRDCIRAVILGSAVNNDGAARAGFSAPGEAGQAAVIAEALAVAAVDPASIEYVETHGTATALGDAVELRGLERAFRGCPPASIRLGAVKANIGHANAAAGIAGLCKTVLALEHGVIPPMPGRGEAAAVGTFLVPAERSPWKNRPARAGVSSFGQGGTNAHVVLESAPQLQAGPEDTGRMRVIVLSARSAEELEDATKQLVKRLVRDRPNLDDVAFTLRTGRKRFPHRRAVLCHTIAELSETLAKRDPRFVADRIDHSNDRPVEFLFPPGSANREELVRRWADWGVRPARTDSFPGIGSTSLKLVLAPPDHPAGFLAECNTPLERGRFEKVLAELWLAGAAIDPGAAIEPPAARRIPLPTYPFRRTSHWISASGNVPAPQPPAADLLDDVLGEFRQVLGSRGIGPDDDFFALGGTSLTMMSVVLHLEERLGRELDPDLVIRKPTPRLISEAIAGKAARADQSEDSARAAIRMIAKPDFVPPMASPPRDVLLTGATGFLGAHLLDEFLRKDVTVHCLVRAANPEEARDRAWGSRRCFGLPECGEERIRWIPGDIVRPRFGLSPAEWESLRGTVHLAVHAAAMVNFVQPYAALAPVNVAGFAGILEFARGRPIGVHLVSSVAAFECESYRGRNAVNEDDDLAECRGFAGGYDLTKWTAERMAMAMRPHPVAIHRVSNVAGHSRTGRMPANQILTAFVRGCRRLGAAPGERDTLNVVPVDIAAEWIVSLAMASPGRPANYHVVHPRPLEISSLVEWMNRRGAAIRFLPEGQWRDRLRGDADNPFRPFLPLLDRRSLFTNRSFDRSNLRRILGTRADDCPAMKDLLDRYAAELEI